MLKRLDWTFVHWTVLSTVVCDDVIRRITYIVTCKLDFRLRPKTIEAYPSFTFVSVSEKTHRFIFAFSFTAEN
jgi:hypothetical protein